MLVEHRRPLLNATPTSILEDFSLAVEELKRKLPNGDNQQDAATLEEFRLAIDVMKGNLTAKNHGESNGAQKQNSKPIEDPLEAIGMAITICLCAIPAIGPITILVALSAIFAPCYIIVFVKFLRMI